MDLYIMNIHVEQIKYVDVEWVPSCHGNGAQRFCLWEKKYFELMDVMSPYL